MLRKKKNNLRWLEFELLQCFPEVKHAIFLNPPLGEKTFLENCDEALEHLELKECFSYRRNKNTFHHGTLAAII